MVEAVAGAVAVHFDLQLIMQAAQVTLHCLQPRGNLKFSDLYLPTPLSLPNTYKKKYWKA